MDMIVLILLMNFRSHGHGPISLSEVPKLIPFLLLLNAITIFFSYVREDRNDWLFVSLSYATEESNMGVFNRLKLDETSINPNNYEQYSIYAARKKEIFRQKQKEDY